MNAILTAAMLLAITAPATADDPGDATLHEVALSDGEDIVQLNVYRQDDPRQYEFEAPGSAIRLPAGRYKILNMRLGGVYGGYHYAAPVRDRESLVVSADGENAWTVGGPLEPSVIVERYGPILTFEFAALDAAGRRLAFAGSHDRENPPRVHVFADGEEIHSGQFEYG